MRTKKGADGQGYALHRASAATLQVNDDGPRLNDDEPTIVGLAPEAIEAIWVTTDYLELAVLSHLMT